MAEAASIESVAVDASRFATVIVEGTHATRVHVVQKDPGVLSGQWGEEETGLEWSNQLFVVRRNSYGPLTGSNVSVWIWRPTYKGTRGYVCINMV